MMTRETKGRLMRPQSRRSVVMRAREGADRTVTYDPPLPPLLPPPPSSCAEPQRVRVLLLTQTAVVKIAP